MIILQSITVILLAVSVFFNITMVSVLYDNEELISQYDYATQYLGNAEKYELNNCKDANTALMRVMSKNQIIKACKLTQLPKLEKQ